jgi:hypothetical protein
MILYFIFIIDISFRLLIIAITLRFIDIDIIDIIDTPFSLLITPLIIFADIIDYFIDIDADYYY